MLILTLYTDIYSSHLDWRGRCPVIDIQDRLRYYLRIQSRQKALFKEMGVLQKTHCVKLRKEIESETGGIGPKH